MTGADRYSLSELSALFGAIRSRLGAQTDAAEVRQLLCELAVQHVPGAERAGITIGRQAQHFATVAATDDLVHRIDAIQYELGTGPCVDAIVKQTTYNAADLRTDPRWPAFGRRAFQRAGIVSMLSMRLYVETDRGVIAGLNLYSRSSQAFDEASETIALLLATHGALAVGRASANEKARNLLIALERSREIGMAMGIVMATHLVTREQAFDVLRLVSQHEHRKLADIAADVVQTGAVPGLPVTRADHSVGARWPAHADPAPAAMRPAR